MGAALDPVCQHCGGKDLRKLVSRVAVLRSEESRMDSLENPSALAGLDESDPASMARWMKKMGQEMGEDFEGEDMDAMIEEAMEEESMGGLGAGGRRRHEAGAGSTLEVWMYERRMDVAFLSQTSGFWAWQVRRHLRPGAFAKLSPQKRQRYADALGVRIEQLEQLP